MRRTTGESQDHFDLLPFIAIMMCLLGGLLLVTLSVAAMSLGPGAGEIWLRGPQPCCSSKIPVLIEWDGTAARVHRQDQTTTLSWSAETRRIKRGGKWYRLGRKLESGAYTLDLAPTQDDRPGIGLLLNDLAAHNKSEYALFAVRPSGFANFNIFSNEFRDRDIDVGYEPVNQNKRVRLANRKAQ